MKIPFTRGRLLTGGFFLYDGIDHFLQYKTPAQYAQSKQVPLSPAFQPEKKRRTPICIASPPDGSETSARARSDSPAWL
jgi:hypothetical protein